MSNYTSADALAALLNMKEGDEMKEALYVLRETLTQRYPDHVEVGATDEALIHVAVSLLLDKSDKTEDELYTFKHTNGETTLASTEDAEITIDDAAATFGIEYPDGVTLVLPLCNIISIRATPVEND